MKQRIIFQITALLLVLLIACNRNSMNATHKDLGCNYSVENIVGVIPAIFGPNIISTKDMEHSSAIISPANCEIYFTRKIDKINTIFYSKLEEGQYVKPKIVSFSGKYFDGAPAFTNDGSRLYFGSKRPVSDSLNEQKDFDIWAVEKTKNGWGKAINIGAPINTDAMEIGQSIASDGSIYFSSNREGGKGKFDIYYSQYIDGKFSNPVNLGSAINTEHHETSPCISPDGRFLLFDVYGRKEGNGIYISYRNENEEWKGSYYLGSEINETGTERFTNFSPDGKYLFFNSMRVLEENDSTQFGNGLGDIYWVDAKIIGF